MAKRRFQIDQLIINFPYEEPSTYWSYDREIRMFERKDGRRPAGHIVATPGSKAFDDPGVFVELPLVNQIRPRVKAWREAGYAGVSGITKRLLEHWRDPEERKDRRFFFCQLEAIETLIWLTEASPAERQGIDIPSDGGDFTRLCAKMATGSGKTIVMAMLIAWQVLNKVTYPQDKRYSKNIFIVAPGLTVRNRLQVLVPDNPDGDYYDEFNIVPAGMAQKLRQGNIRVRNWHVLNWETDEKIAKKRSVDKRDRNGGCEVMSVVHAVCPRNVRGHRHGRAITPGVDPVHWTHCGMRARPQLTHDFDRQGMIPILAKSRLQTRFP